MKGLFVRRLVVTGALLAIVRISVETVPLLFTALNNPYWSTTPNGTRENIPVVVFQFATGTYDAWHSPAWAGPFVMMAFVLALAIVSRTFSGRTVKMPSARTSNACISVRGLNFHYGCRQARLNVDVDFHGREVTAITGSSRSGQSTPLRVLNRMYAIYPEQTATDRS